MGVLLISHNMGDVKALADRAIVLRLGRNNGFFDVNTVSQEQIISSITGATESTPAGRPMRRQRGEGPTSRTPRRPRPRSALADAPGAEARKAPRIRRRTDRGELDHFARRKLRAGEVGSLPVVVVLAVVWITFQSLNSNFLSPRNLSNLSVDIVGTGLIAVGIVFVLLLGELDLSVGSISRLAAAVFAVLNVNNGCPVARPDRRGAGR